MDAYKDAITAYGWFYPVVEFLSMLALAGHSDVRRISGFRRGGFRWVWWRLFCNTGCGSSGRFRI